MGIAIPRPQMRARERRIIEARLRRHAELTATFQAEGMSAADASARAYQIVRSEKTADPKYAKR